jgi:hypothetical protein
MYDFVSCLVFNISFVFLQVCKLIFEKKDCGKLYFEDCCSCLVSIYREGQFVAWIKGIVSRDFGIPFFLFDRIYRQFVIGPDQVYLQFFKI